jgi:hypothetical protein
MNVTDPSRTQEGEVVVIGLRVMDYDWNWGNVESGPDSGGWWNVRLDDGRRSYMDGTRLSTGRVARMMGAPADPRL